MKRLLPHSLAARFGLASAGLAAVAVLLVAFGSWWLIERQQSAADARLAARERQFHAANVASTLQALSERMAEVAGSTILATGLVDSAGKETYLDPFLNGIRQIDGLPVQVMFTDFEGQEIASNAGASFEPAQLAWLRERLQTGRAAAQVLPSPEGPQLVAMEPLRYVRTTTPEGAVLYKIALRDMALDGGLSLAWGEAPGNGPPSAVVDAPEVFRGIGFRVTGQSPAVAPLRGRAPEFVAIGSLALLVFSALFVAGWRLARLLTSDLSRLQAFSSEVVGTGGHTARAPEGGSLEVASLARSINQMLERLGEQHRALRQEGEKMRALAQALQRADQRKDEFLAMLAHELRNPLAPIRNGAELLRRRHDSDPQLQRTGEIIFRQVRHMTKIVDDLLDVSRVTRGMVTLEQGTVDLRSAVTTAVDQARPAIEARRQLLQLELPAGPLWVQGDAARLAQVVGNLLQNASKYTQSEGRIDVSAAAAGGEVVLRVADNGSGIPEEFLPEMFGLFTQAQRQADRSQGGLGLGLALVKRLVELHGGSVTGSSAGPGSGSTFTVRLPQGTAPTGAAASGPAPAAPAAPLRVLLVDDNVDAALTLAQLLRMEGHAVDVAHDARAALDLVQRQPADAYILDIGLPGMDGMELARRLRAMPGAREALLVALTGYGQAADRQASAGAGFDYHLVKPVDPLLLHSVLAEATGRAMRATGATA